MREATRRLAAAETASASRAADDAVADDLCGLVTALISLSEHVLDSRGIGMDIALTALDPWERAALSMHQSLRLARRFMLGLSSADGYARPTPLAAIATPLQAAGDLLSTHRKRPAGQRAADCSPWAPVVSSNIVSRALAAEIGHWAGLLAPWALWGSQSASPHLAGDFLAVSRCLQTAHAPGAISVTTDDRDLLYGIPDAYPPERIPPGGNESVEELCTGIAVTAERLRLAAFLAPDHAAWSPSVSARGWERSARAAAIASHTAGQTLQTLSNQANMLGPAVDATVRAADARLITARDTWLNTAQTLHAITTESANSLTRMAAEAQDLMLRLGRLASGNSRWTPAKQDQVTEQRVPGELVPDAATARAVLAAVHQAADALAVLADRDLATVANAEAAGRLYVPTRQLPLKYDVPRPYGPAPAERVAELKAAYASTITAARTATEQLADIAITTHAPSRVLALARRATFADQDQQTPTAAQLAAQDRPHSPKQATDRPASRTAARDRDQEQGRRRSQRAQQSPAPARARRIP
jgi:hypothetical protein